MCVLCSSRSVKKGSGAVCPRGVRSQGGMFILSTAFDLLLLITSCTLYMNQATPCCWLTSDTGREGGRAAILDFLNRKTCKGQWVKSCSLLVFNDHQINVLTTLNKLKFRTSTVQNCLFIWNRAGQIVWDFQEQQGQSYSKAAMLETYVHLPHHVVWVLVTVCGQYNSKCLRMLQKSPTLNATDHMRRDSEVLAHIDWLSGFYISSRSLSSSLSCSLSRRCTPPWLHDPIQQPSPLPI